MHDRNFSKSTQDLLKSQNENTCDIAFEDISKELFWQGYNIWQARKKKMEEFWKNIAPDNWKLHNKEIKNRKKLNEIKLSQTCRNPFHFLLKNKNLSGQKPTVCFCSRIQSAPPVIKIKNISSFFRNHIEDKKSNIIMLQFGRKPSHITRDALIRGEHNRGKCAH